LSSSEIKLDLDNCSRAGLLRLIRSRRWRFLFQFRWPRFGRLRVLKASVKRTWHGFHVSIRVRNRIPKRDLNFLQLALGSDYRRESMNLRRIVSCKQMKSWNILYSYKFNGRGDFTSREDYDARLSRQISHALANLQRKTRCKRKDSNQLNSTYKHASPATSFAGTTGSKTQTQLSEFRKRG
jgi:hypothetical protein